MSTPDDFKNTLSDIAAPFTLGAVRDSKRTPIRTNETQEAELGFQPETKPAHTPWVMCYSQDAITIYSEENPMIARLGVETVDMKNAEFIVRACNSHDELVAALNFIQSEPNNPRAHRAAFDALAKATGGAK